MSASGRGIHQTDSERLQELEDRLLALTIERLHDSVPELNRFPSDVQETVRDLPMSEREYLLRLVVEEMAVQESRQQLHDQPTKGSSLSELSELPERSTSVTRSYSNDEIDAGSKEQLARNVPRDTARPVSSHIRGLTITTALAVAIFALIFVQIWRLVECSRDDAARASGNNQSLTLIGTALILVVIYAAFAVVDVIRSRHREAEDVALRQEIYARERKVVDDIYNTLIERPDKYSHS